jgi:hypothetical protein
LHPKSTMGLTKLKMLKLSLRTSERKRGFE